jgi:leader peptidase (prepilin peptidase) / N-methyltransferase
MWPRAEPAAALLLTALGGWLWGSFLNQLAERTPLRAPLRGLPRDPARPGALAGPPPGVTLLRPQRSLCFACGRPIAWYDNVPVLAYLWLRGRCRACGAPIGRRTLLLEAATPLALTGWHAAWLAHSWPPALLMWGLAALSWLLLTAVLLAEGRRLRAALLPGAALLAALAYLATLG